MEGGRVIQLLGTLLVVPTLQETPQSQGEDGYVVITGRVPLNYLDNEPHTMAVQPSKKSIEGCISKYQFIQFHKKVNTKRLTYCPFHQFKAAVCDGRYRFRLGKHANDVKKGSNPLFGIPLKWLETVYVSTNAMLGLRTDQCKAASLKLLLHSTLLSAVTKPLYTTLVPYTYPADLMSVDSAGIRGINLRMNNIFHHSIKLILKADVNSQLLWWSSQTKLQNVNQIVTT